MRIIDILKVSLKNIFRSKSSFLIMILIFTCSVSSLFSLSYKNSFNKYWDVYVQKSPEFRIINVLYKSILEENHEGLSKEQILEIEKKETDNIIKKLLENEHILGASTQFMQSIDILDFNSNNNLSSLYLQSVPINNKINVILGNNLDQYEDGDYVMICPNVAKLPDRNGNFNINNSLDLKKYLNNELTVNYALNVPIKYKLVGLYDNFSTYSYGQVCYTSYKSLEKAQNVYYEKNPDIYQSWLEYKKDDYYTNVYFMIDDIKNLDQVNKYLNENNWRSDSIVDINTDTVWKISHICDRVTFCLYILIVMIIGLSLVQNILKKSKDLLIYYSCGYKNIDIIKLIFTENLLLIIIPSIFSILVTQLMLKFYKCRVLSNNPRLYLMNPTVDIYSVFLTFSLLIIIPFVVTIIIFIFSKIKLDQWEE